MKDSRLPMALPLLLALCCLAPVLVASGLGAALVAWFAGLGWIGSTLVVAASLAATGLIGRKLRRHHLQQHTTELPHRPRRTHLLRILPWIALILILATLVVPFVVLLYT